MNLNDLFAIPLAREPHRVALRFRGVDGQVADWSYAALHARAAAMANALAARGVGPGDRVAFFLSNRPEFVALYLGVLRRGAALLPINLAYRRREIAHMLADAEPRLVITEESLRPLFDELPPEELAGALPVNVEDLSADLAGEKQPGVRVDGGDLALLMYTSGTTGRSKGAMLSHDNVLATVTALLAAWAWSDRDELLLALPLFHTHGLVVGLTCALAAGAAVHLRSRFDAAAVLDDLGETGASLFFGVPTMYVRLVEELRRRDGDPRRFRRQRLFCCGSAALSPDTFAAFAEATGHQILERYGMTETGMLLSNPYAGERRAGTVGTPLPGVSARIVDESGGDAVEGELLVRGSNVLSGYWRAAEKTASSFTTDTQGARWFRTGDLARRDPLTGYITLIGRRSELIISGGFNIYPREIEEVLEAFPGVREAAVVGRPHPEWGEVPTAFLVVESEIDEASIVAHCKAQLAAFKTPKMFRRVDALPRNALGKVQKHLLPEW